MIKLSVNVNKVATLRNSRGGRIPSVLEAARVCLDAGAHGITVHPRADRRHITPDDVLALSGMLGSPPVWREGPGSEGPEGTAQEGRASARQEGQALAAREGQASAFAEAAADRSVRPIEFNIEGDPRPELLALVREVRPDQCTLVPVKPGEITSQAGWSPGTPHEPLAQVVRDLQALGIRVSLFVDPDPAAVDWAADVGGDRVELYTEPFARAFEEGGHTRATSLDLYTAAARHAQRCGLGVNAGHDLDLDNLRLFRTVPHLAEVSIGHALISRALFVGLERTVHEYLAVLTETSA